jgi:hypothetical protein
MVVDQTTDSTNRIHRLVTIIIISSSSLYSSMRKALSHHSLILNFLASLLTSSRHLEFVLPTFIFLWSPSTYVYLGQLILFVYFTWTAKCNHVTLMTLVNYGPLYNLYNSELYLPLQSPTFCIGPQILLKTFLSISSRFHSPGCKCIQHSAPYLAVGLTTVLYMDFLCQWHGLGFRCFGRSN